MSFKKHDIYSVPIKGTCDYKSGQTGVRLFQNVSWELVASRWQFEHMSILMVSSLFYDKFL